jgi:hypothetical protein
VGSELLVVVELELDELVESSVEVLVCPAVEGGRVLVVGAAEVGGGRVGRDAGEPARRSPAVVEEIPAKRLLGGLVVDSLATAGGDRVGVPGEEGAVRIPSRLPPHAPTATATASVAHRRSRLNRTNAPACSSPVDGKRIGRLRLGLGLIGTLRGSDGCWWLVQFCWLGAPPPLRVRSS